MDATARLVFDKTDDVIQALSEGAKRVVLSTCQAVEAVAGGLSRIESGAMANAFYHIGLGEDTYDEAVARASSLYSTRHNGEFPAADKVDPPEVAPGVHKVYISNVAAYSTVQELGGHGIDASGALTTAAEGQRGGFIAAMIEALGHE